MADITATGTTSYPTTIDTRTILADGSSGDEIVAENPNGPAAAIIAVETELGTLPKGSAADLTTRLAVALNNDGTVKSSVVTSSFVTYAAGVFTLNPLTGTWTPVDVSGASLTFTVNNAQYIKIGKLVHVGGDITYPATTNSLTAKIGGLPFVTQTTSNDYFGGSPMLATATPTNLAISFSSASTSFSVINITSGSAQINATMSSTILRFFLPYMVNA